MTDLITRPTHPPTAPSTTVTVSPLAATIGAELGGVDLSRPLDEATVAAIEAALDRWRVVFFRGQTLDHAAQIAFGRHFGDLTYAHPHDDHPPEGHPEIYTVDPSRFAAQYGIDGDAAKALRKRYSYTNGWHTDVTPAINPPAGSILRAEVVPEYGGDTTFTNLVAAYEGLSPAVQELIDGLRAEHLYGANLTGAAATSFAKRFEQNRLVSHHPVVRVHPRTGERALFVNPVFTSRIVGLNPDESRRILDLLFEQLARPAYTVRFRWDAGSVAFWDNRATAHLGPQDLDDLDVARTLHRVTLIGEIPVGPDGRESELIEGVPFRSAPVFDPATS